MELKILKRIFIGVVTAVWLCTATVFAEEALPNFLGASVDAEVMQKGKEIVLSITAEGEEVRGFQFDIEYDGDMLEYSQLQTSDIFDDAIAVGINDNDAGYIRVIAAYDEEQKISGELLRVTFTARCTSTAVPVKITGIKVETNKKFKENEITFSGCYTAVYEDGIIDISVKNSMLEGDAVLAVALKASADNRLANVYLINLSNAVWESNFRINASHFSGQFNEIKFMLLDESEFMKPIEKSKKLSL